MFSLKNKLSISLRFVPVRFANLSSRFCYWIGFLFIRHPKCHSRIGMPSFRKLFTETPLMVLLTHRLHWHRVQRNWRYTDTRRSATALKDPSAFTGELTFTGTPALGEIRSQTYRCSAYHCHTDVSLCRLQFTCKIFWRPLDTTRRLTENFHWIRA